MHHVYINWIYLEQKFSRIYVKMPIIKEELYKYILSRCCFIVLILNSQRHENMLQVLWSWD